MLQAIREKTSGPLAWIIVGIISVPFAFFGIEAFQSGGGSDFAAKVNGESITRFALDNRVDAQYEQFRQMLGDSFRPDMLNRAQMREGVLQSMIDEELLRQHMLEAGYRVPDAQVAEFVASQDAFQDADGRFSREAYREVLARQGNSIAMYEARVRDFLSATQFETALRDTAFVTPAELAAEWAWEKQERTLRWRQYDLNVFRAGADVAAADIEALYTERKAQLQTPERVRAAYLLLDPAAAAQSIEISDSQIEAEYQAQRQRYEIPETRTARHILVSSESQAQELRAEIVSDAIDFAAAAQASSEDPGSKDAGGDLGPISRGVMVPPFEEAVFGLEQGVLSEPVQTEFGWHLIEVTAIAGGGVKPLAEVRDAIVESLRNSAARAEIARAREELEQLTFENPTSLEPAAQALDLEVQVSDWFTRSGGAGITANPGVRDAAFSDSILEQGENSSLLALDGGRVAVLRIAEREVSRQQTLEEVRAELAAELRQKQARERLAAARDADRAALESGTEWDALPAREGVQERPASEFARDAQGEDSGLLRAAFAAPPEPGLINAPLRDGGMALVQILSVRDGDLAQATPAERSRLRQQMQQRVAGVESQSLTSILRAQADIRLAQRDSETEETF